MHSVSVCGAEMFNAHPFMLSIFLDLTKLRVITFIILQLSIIYKLNWRNHAHLSAQ